MKRLLSRFGIAAVILLAVSFPFYLSGYYVQTLTLVFINVILVQSLNILTGYAGQISLGQAGLYAVGAYGSAVMMMELSLPFYASVPAAILLAVGVGLLLSLPARRVTEFYLAMLTLGFGIVVNIVVREWPLLGGFSGLSLIPSPITSSLTIFGLIIDPAIYYYVAFVMMLLAALLTRNLVRSHVGRMFLGIREDEIAAASMGINPGRTKQLAYAVSAGLAGLAGALYAHYIAYLGYGQFDLLKSIEILTMALIGGLGSFLGPFIGGAFETWLPQILQTFGDYQLLIYGIILVTVIRFWPSGLAGVLRIKDSYINLTSEEIETAIQASVAQSAVERDTGLQASSDLDTTDPVESGDEIISVREVTKTFDSLMALNQVSAQFNRGEIHGLIGPNGSGKSTLINVITGAYTVTEGEIIYEGESVVRHRMHQLAISGIIRIFQDPRLIPEATVLENVVLGAQRRLKAGFFFAASGFLNKNEERHWTGQALQNLVRCGIGEYANEVVSRLPYGTRRLTEIARALTAEPKVLILDEPAAGLSEVEITSLVNVLRDLKSSGTTVIVIEHNMQFIADIVDNVIVLDEGKVIYKGDTSGMQTDTNVVEAYLGTV